MNNTLLAENTLAAFTVCADADLIALATETATRVPGMAFAGNFDSYFRSGQRPRFSENMRNAAGCIAFIDFDRAPEGALEAAEALHWMSSPSVVPVGVSARMEADILLRAMRSGCSEFLEKPVTLGQMTETLERIRNRIFVRLGSPSPGRVISLFGAKGGVGTTTLAVYLAAYLARQHGKKTLLIDHNHQLGHVNLLLGLKENNYHFDDLIRNADRLDSELLHGFVERHSCGLAVISSPSVCAPRQATAPEEMERLFAFLRREFDFTVLDSSLLYEDAAPIMQNSDNVYLVATPDVAALRDLSLHIEHLGLANMQSGKLGVAINRSSSQDAIKEEQIERVLRFPVAVSIPNNYAELLNAVNAGEPIWPHRRSEFTARFSRWAGDLAGAAGKPPAAAPKKARRPFAFWKTAKPDTVRAEKARDDADQTRHPTGLRELSHL